jgi:phosphate transport system substrate-binding protein
MRLLLISLIMFLMSTVSYARDQISIVGSSTVFPFSTVVAEKVGKKGIKTPVIESTGTGGGMKLFCKGIGVNTPDMTNASRAIKPKEKEMCFNNGVTDISQVIIGLDGIAIIHSASNNTVNFTVEQLWQALSAKGSLPTKWSDIDSSLPDVKIGVLVPPPTSGTRDAFNELVMAKGCPKEVKEANKKDCTLLREDGAAIEAGENDTLIINKIVAEPNNFGILGYSYYDANKDKVRAVTINGKSISKQSIQDGSYPISRPLYFYVKNQHKGVIPGIDEYIKEFTSKRAISNRGYLTDLGLVPLANPQEAITPVK